MKFATEIVDVPPIDLKNPLPLRGVGTRRIVGFGIAYGACFAFFVGHVWSRSFPSVSWSVFADNLGPFEFIGSLVIVIIVHELCHHAAWSSDPIVQEARHPIIGFDLRQHFVAFSMVVYPVRRDRFVLVLMVPCLMLTFLPFLLAWCGVPNVETLGFVSVLNAMTTGGDLFIAQQVITQVRRQAYVQGDFFSNALKAASSDPI